MAPRGRAAAPVLTTMAAPRASTDSSWLVLPALALLVLGFIGPMVLFFVKTLAQQGGAAELLELFTRILSSEAVSAALLRTLWIGLLVTLAVLLISYPMAYYMANTGGLRFTLLLFCIVVVRCWRIAGQQKGFSIGGLLVNRDAHVTERRHDRLNLLCVYHAFRQVVVDFRIRQIATLFTELKQGLELCLAGL